MVKLFKLQGPEPKKEYHHQETQVGIDNLRPFTIDRGNFIHVLKKRSANKHGCQSFFCEAPKLSPKKHHK